MIFFNRTIFVSISHDEDNILNQHHIDTARYDYTFLIFRYHDTI